MVTLDGRPLAVQASVLAPFLLTVYQANVVIQADRAGNLTLTITSAGQTSQESLLPVAP